MAVRSLQLEMSIEEQGNNYEARQNAEAHLIEFGEQSNAFPESERLR